MTEAVELAVKRNYEGQIWSHIRKKWLIETPEEAVRQEYLCILVNEYGIYMAPTARIDVGSLVLSTRDITNQNFLAGEHIFRRVSQKDLDMLLLNEGEINIEKGGFGVLIAGAIENRGLISAKAGIIALAGGDAVKLELAGNGLISIIIDEAVAREILDYQGRPVTEQIRNTGTLDAEGGSVIIAASSINDIFTRAMNLQGVIHGALLVKNGEGAMRIATADETAVPTVEPEPLPVIILATAEEPQSAIATCPYLDIFKGNRWLFF